MQKNNTIGKLIVFDPSVLTHLRTTQAQNRGTFQSNKKHSVARFQRATKHFSRMTSVMGSLTTGTSSLRECNHTPHVNTREHQAAVSAADNSGHTGQKQFEHYGTNLC